MNRVGALKKLELIFQEVFDDDNISLLESTTAKDVDGWDSLMNMTLMLEIEDAFGVAFSMKEKETFKCVGDIIDVLGIR